MGVLQLVHIDLQSHGVGRRKVFTEAGAEALRKRLTPQRQNSTDSSGTAGKGIRFGFIGVHQGVRRDELSQSVDVFSVLPVEQNKGVQLTCCSTLDSSALTHFHSCSRSLMASFFRPYFSLKLAASRTSAR